jgi:hypothetical protein
MCSFIYEGKQLNPAAVVIFAREHSQSGFTLPKRGYINVVVQSPSDTDIVSCTVYGSYAQIDDGDGAGIIIRREVC